MFYLLDVRHLIMKYQLSPLIPVTNGEGHCKKCWKTLCWRWGSGCLDKDKEKT